MKIKILITLTLALAVNFARAGFQNGIMYDSTTRTVAATNITWAGKQTFLGGLSIATNGGIFICQIPITNMPPNTNIFFTYNASDSTINGQWWWNPNMQINTGSGIVQGMLTNLQGQVIFYDPFVTGAQVISSNDPNYTLSDVKWFAVGAATPAGPSNMWATLTFNDGNPPSGTFGTNFVTSQNNLFSTNTGFAAGTNVYWVDQNNPNASDGNVGSQTLPLMTLGQGLNYATNKTPSILHLGRGIYTINTTAAPYALPDGVSLIGAGVNQTFISNSMSFQGNVLVQGITFISYVYIFATNGENLYLKDCVVGAGIGADALDGTAFSGGKIFVQNNTFLGAWDTGGNCFADTNGEWYISGNLFRSVNDPEHFNPANFTRTLFCAGMAQETNAGTYFVSGNTFVISNAFTAVGVGGGNTAQMNMFVGAREGAQVFLGPNTYANLGCSNNFVAFPVVDPGSRITIDTPDYTTVILTNGLSGMTSFTTYKLPPQSDIRTGETNVSSATTITFIFSKPVSQSTLTNYSVGLAPFGATLTSPEVTAKTTNGFTMTLSSFSGKLDYTATPWQ